jgi:hypothetical protein
MTQIGCEQGCIVISGVSRFDQAGDGLMSCASAMQFGHGLFLNGNLASFAQI